MEDYINRKTDGVECRVKQLFYRRARGKSIVRLDSESDISALLDEYPLRHPLNKNSTCSRTGHTTIGAILMQISDPS